jgi:galactonate dehydratase
MACNQRREDDGGSRRGDDEKRRSTVKIEEVNSYVVEDFHFVSVTSDTGQVGWGQSACWGYPRAVHAVVEAMRPNLLGADPERVEHLWHVTTRMAPFRGSVIGGAVSAINIALWDLVGKFHDAPVYSFLGGRVRDRVRLLALIESGSFDEVLNSVRQAVDAGFTAVKVFLLPDGYQDLSLSELEREVTDRTGAVRSLIGDKVDLVLEFGRRLSMLTAVPILTSVARFKPIFCEDPIQPDSLASQAELARRVPVAIALGERMHNVWEFRELFASGGAHYARPDVGLAGGITGCRKIAAVAESFNSLVVTHNYSGPLITAASIQFDASVHNIVFQEYSLRDEVLIYPGLTTACRRVGGDIVVPDAPGLGIELRTPSSEDAWPQLMEGAIYRLLFRVDGAVALGV